MPDSIDVQPELVALLGQQAFELCVLRARLRAYAQADRADEERPTPPHVHEDTRASGD